MNCETPEKFRLKLIIIERLGSILIREGFRQFINLYKFKFEKMVKNSTVLQKIMQSETVEDVAEMEWLQRMVKFIVLGISCPIQFLWELQLKF